MSSARLRTYLFCFTHTTLEVRTLAVDMFVSYYLLVNDRAITSVTADVSIIALDRYKVNTIVQ